MDKKFVNNLIVVGFSNLIVLFASILSGLVIPKLLGTLDYGLYKTFTLYLSYTTLLHFGFVDGILLYHGADSYEQMNKQYFKINTLFFTIMQIAIMFGLVFFAQFFCIEFSSKFVIIMVGVDGLITNMTNYLQAVSQCTMRFRELSLRKILQAVFKIFAISIVCLNINSSVNKAIEYIVLLVLIDLLLLGWYIHTYRDLCGLARIGKNDLSRIKGYFNKGIILTLAYQVSNLVLVVDQQFVLSLFPKETYGEYAFAYSIVAMAITVIWALSYVLFPTLKRMDESSIMKSFSNNIAYVTSFVFFCLGAYNALELFITWYLPEYANSLMYLKIIFPGLALTSCISIIIFTYYKVLDKNIIFFKLSGFALVLAIVTDFFVYKIFGSPSAISWASIFTMLIWYLLSEKYFVKKYSVAWIKNMIYLCVMMGVFYLSVFISFEKMISAIFYVIAYLIITITFYYKEIKMLIIKS